MAERMGALRALLAGVVLIWAAPVAAQDAIWSTTPGTGDFNTSATWTPATVPGGTTGTGTASFGTSTLRVVMTGAAAGWANARSAVPTISYQFELVGTLRFADPTR